MQLTDQNSKILKYYVHINIIAILAYNLLTYQLPITEYTFIQFFLSLNLILISYYCLFKNNIILEGSELLKSSTVAIVTEYALVWELLKLITASEVRARSLVNYVYSGLILLHIALSNRYPSFFTKFLKFNFGFSIQYAILLAFNTKLKPIISPTIVGIVAIYYNSITPNYMTIFSSNALYCLIMLETCNTKLNPIIPATIIGIVAIYYNSITLNYMTIFSSNALYSLIMLEGIIPLIIITSPSKDEATVLIGMLVASIAIFIFYVVAVIIQFRAINREGGYNRVDNVDEEEGGASHNNDNTGNYSTFTN